MPTINGNVKWGQVPKWDAADNMNSQQSDFNNNNLVSANKPMIYQAIWTYTTPPNNINEQSIPKNEDDVMNCIFHICTTTEYPLPATTDLWDEVATIRKTRDMVNTNIVNTDIPENQRFTIDISQIIQDQLSYTLVPVGKGSFQNQEFGGMNGGTTKQDNITETISPYNVTRNGAYRAVRVWCGFEQFNNKLELVLSDDTLGFNADYVDTVRAVNSIPDFMQSTYYQSQFVLQQWSVSSTDQKKALTNSPYEHWSSAADPANIMKKTVRLTEYAEWLYFYVDATWNGDDATEYYNLYEVYGETYNTAGVLQDTFVLGSEWGYPTGTPTNTRIQSDLSHAMTYEGASTTKFAHDQEQIAVQNVSPAYINAHAYPPQEAFYPYTGAQFSPITAYTDYYRVYVRAVYYDDTNTVWVTKRPSNVYYYKLDNQLGGGRSNQQQGPYDMVRFHWLNTMGGIDSYTATRNVLESLSVNKSLITKALPPKNFYQSAVTSAGAAIDIYDYHNDSMRNWNAYKGGKEVLSVDANINNQVYTEPLNKAEATWLREIFTSPNVWIETPSKDDINQDAAYVANDMNPYLRPIKTQYTPVILTNSEIVSLDQEKGLVQFNIEYTMAQGVLTQRN